MEKPDDGEVRLVCCQPQHNQISVRSTQDMLHIIHFNRAGLVFAFAP